MAVSIEAYQVQRERHFAIVDEVDNILIDEARTPLIISGPARGQRRSTRRFAAPRAAAAARGGLHRRREAARGLAHRERRREDREARSKIDNIYAPENYRLTRYMEAALKAQILYQRDRDYVVKDGEVVIVDDFTGRLMFGRRWSDGLHQAVEAKEGVKIQQESITYATITLQNYFRLYDKLAGMTGTAVTEAEEFVKIYKLDVVVIPTNRRWSARTTTTSSTARRGQVRRRRRGDRGAARDGPARARRHRLDRELGVPLGAAEAARHRRTRC